MASDTLKIRNEHQMFCWNIVVNYIHLTSMHVAAAMTNAMINISDIQIHFKLFDGFVRGVI